MGKSISKSSYHNEAGEVQYTRKKLKCLSRTQERDQGREIKSSLLYGWDHVEAGEEVHVGR